MALLAIGLLAATAPLAEPGRTLVLGVTAAQSSSWPRPRSPGRRSGPLAAHLVVTVGAGGTVAAVLAVVSGAPER